ncbi:MAG: hypothetical protein AAGH87_06405 [Pseudomonadota bacterium]
MKIAGWSPAWVASQRMQIGLAVLAVWSAFLIFGIATWDGHSMGNDDLMRLLQVRGLIDGQAWWDVSQPRLETDAGGAIHWSRLPDIFLLALIGVAEPLVGGPQAERFALAVWPRLILLGVLAAMSAALVRLGAGRLAIAAACLVFLMSHAMAQVQPGRIDHHGFVLLMSLVGFAAMAAPGAGWRSGAALGAASVAALTVAIEGLPYIGVLLALAGCLWLAAAPRAASLLTGLGAALLAFTPLAFLLDAPGPATGRDVCDALGTFHVVGLMATGAGCLVLASATPWLSLFRGRLALGAAVGGGAVLAALVTNPSCLGSPYGDIDGEIVTGWMASVGEARSLVRLMGAAPDTAVAVFGFAGAGVLAGLIALSWAEGGRRLAIAGLVACTVIALLVTSWQVRGVAFAHAFSAICVGLAVQGLWARARRIEGPARAGLLGLALAFMPTTWQGAGAYFAPAKEDPANGVGQAQIDCRAPQALAELSALPQGLVFTPIDLGAVVLAHTDHRVTAAPYHRNAGAIARAIAVFEADPQTAGTLLEGSGADYLIACANLAEMKAYARRAPGGLAAALAAGDVPDYLIDAAAPESGEAAGEAAGQVRIWRIAPAGGRGPIGS